MSKPLRLGKLSDFHYRLLYAAEWPGLVALSSQYYCCFGCPAAVFVAAVLNQYLRCSDCLAAVFVAAVLRCSGCLAAISGQ